MSIRASEALDLESEQALIDRAQSGDPSALELLIKSSQPWLFNVVLRMVADFHEAEDLTQEILLKSVLKLSSFKRRSRFRTWLYRIALNQVLDRRRSDQERGLARSADFFADDRNMEDYLARELPDTKTLPPDLSLLVREAEIKCMLGMLLCLSRRQRMAYILGETLEVGSKVGAEVMGSTEAAFRKLLSRARRRLASFMLDRCGLLNPGKPCRCERSVAPNVATGYIDPERLEYAGHEAPVLREGVARARRAFDSLVAGKCGDLYRALPFRESPDFSKRVLAIVESEEFRRVMEADALLPA